MLIISSTFPLSISTWLLLTDCVWTKLVVYCFHAEMSKLKLSELNHPVTRIEDLNEPPESSTY
ncbi:hypothetical protein AKJ16_DCAP12860 [Drosera capensis]